LPLIVGAGVLLFGGGGVIGYLGLEQPAAAPASGGEHARPIESEPGVIELEPFILNLADAAGDRYLRLDVRLVLDQLEVAQRASEGLAEVKLRDRVLSVLAKKRASELSTAAGKDRLRAEILATVEPLLSEPPFFAHDARAARVREVFFTEFLLQ